MDNNDKCKDLQTDVNNAIISARSCFSAYPLSPGTNNHEKQSTCISNALIKKGEAMKKLNESNCTPMNEGGRTRKSNRKQSRKSNRKQSRKSNRKHKTRVKNL